MLLMLLGSACTLVGGALGFAFATNIDATAEAKWWDLMTAFGTCGAVLVAVLIPFFQHRAYRKAEAGRKSESQLISATRTVEIAKRCKNAVDRLRSNAMEASIESSKDEFDRLHSEVSALFLQLSDELSHAYLSTIQDIIIRGSSLIEAPEHAKALIAERAYANFRGLQDEAMGVCERAQSRLNDLS